MTTNNDNINVAKNVAQRNLQDKELIKKIFPHKEIIEGESVLVFPYIEEASPLKDLPQEVVSNMEKTIDHISQEEKKVSLTEQWKKGELKVEEEYWVILTDELYLRSPEPVRAFYSCEYEFEGYLDNDIKEVLSPVPSYCDCLINEALIKDLSKKVNKPIEENQRLKKVERKKGKLVNENYKLKKLLKECKSYIIRNVVFTAVNRAVVVDLEKNELLTKIDEVLK